MNWFPNHAVSVYLTSMYLLHYNICKRSPSYTSKVLIKKDAKKSKLYEGEVQGTCGCGLLQSVWTSLYRTAKCCSDWTKWERLGLRGKEWKNLHRLICPAQEMFSRSGYTAAEGSMCDSRAAPRSCSGSSSYVFACRCNATVRKQAFGREVTELEPERNKDCLWGFHLPV